MLTPFSVGYGETFVLQPYGENWRKQRRLVAQDFGQTMAPRYHSLQEKEARILVRNILKDPGNLVSQIKLYVTELYMKETSHWFTPQEDWHHYHPDNLWLLYPKRG